MGIYLVISWVKILKPLRRLMGHGVETYTGNCVGKMPLFQSILFVTLLPVHTIQEFSCSVSSPVSDVAGLWVYKPSFLDSECLSSPEEC